ncbi:YopX family protein [Campylobacter hyointestinalis]|uniref:YopX family protein n=1 Tax=Campylobacter hyointestinalis TaxID=198 RepID=UPI0007293F42|nr:YopX family protein [Campylobacter hyointestinalis]CUU77235.1 YopX protein [Campylobacter hyointestinalis subsp. hyointestinalis]
MKEIKFKAYFKVDKRIYDVWAINFSREEIELFDKKMQVDFEASFDDVELMQYTGYKDKDGVEIYEGDILQGIYEMHNELCVALFKDGQFCFFNPKGECIFFIVGQNSEITCEVIGNIYENEELLVGEMINE